MLHGIPKGRWLTGLNYRGLTCSVMMQLAVLVDISKFNSVSERFEASRAALLGFSIFMPNGLGAGRENSNYLSPRHLIGFKKKDYNHVRSQFYL